MVDNVKINIVEKNGIELEFAEELELISLNIPYNNSDSELTSNNVKEAIDEVVTNIGQSASPGFSWGRSGNLSTNTWLLNEGVSSNKAGRTVTFSSPSITRIFTASENSASYTITIYEHEGDGINLTALTTLSSSSARTADSGAVEVGVTEGRQLAIRITSGSAKNLVVGMTLSGENI